MNVETSNEEKQFNYALSLRDDGDLIGATREFEDILNKAPKHPAAAYGMLGHLYFQLGDFDNALNSYLKSTALSPKSELGSLGLFHTLWKLDRKDDALAEAKRFLELRASKEYEMLFDEIGERPD